MKTTLIATLVFMIPFLSFSQTKMSIDLIGGMDYSHRSLSAPGEDRDLMLIIGFRDNNEIGNLGWRAGVNYNLSLTSKIFLRTGLRFANVGYQEKKRELRFGAPEPGLPTEVQMTYNYLFTEIPIVIRYEINHKKLSPFVELGILSSIFMGARLRTKTNLGSDTESLKSDIYHFRRVHEVGFISFGLNYALNDNFQLFGQPAFRYHFTAITDSPVEERLYNFGIEVGVRRKLR